MEGKAKEREKRKALFLNQGPKIVLPALIIRTRLWSAMATPYPLERLSDENIKCQFSLTEQVCGKFVPSRHPAFLNHIAADSNMTSRVTCGLSIPCSGHILGHDAQRVLHNRRVCNKGRVEVPCPMPLCARR